MIKANQLQTKNQQQDSSLRCLMLLGHSTGLCPCQACWLSCSRGSRKCINHIMYYSMLVSFSIIQNEIESIQASELQGIILASHLQTLLIFVAQFSPRTLQILQAWMPWLPGVAQKVFSPQTEARQEKQSELKRLKQMRMDPRTRSTNTPWDRGGFQKTFVGSQEPVTGSWSSIIHVFINLYVGI